MTAGLARRLAALLYESLLVAAIVIVAGFALAPFVSPGSSVGARPLTMPSTTALVFQFCALFAIVATYFVWSWSDGRRTLPMKTWQLALVTSESGPLTRRIALARYLAAWIGPVLAVFAYFLTQSRWSALLLATNYCWVWADPDRQFLHDRIAGSRLVTMPKAS